MTADADLFAFVAMTLLFVALATCAVVACARVADWITDTVEKHT